MELFPRKNISASGSMDVLMSGCVTFIFFRHCSEHYFLRAEKLHHVVITVHICTRLKSKNMTAILNKLHISHVLLFVLYLSDVLRFSAVIAQENHESLDLSLSEDAVSDLENSPKFVESEEPHSLPKRQYKTAEIADALMGTETPIDRSDIESLFPKNVIDLQSGFFPPCDEDSAQCGSPELAAAGESLEERSDESSQQITLDIVRADTTPTEEQNTTETAKTYKVTCDKRNTTGMDNFSVQVLNASQDLMDFLNANGTECSVVLFFTAWCQFSAGLAPHFNALPRAFPGMHFLALDASQHSSLSTRFGTVAVPNILLFQGAKPMARFNHTDRTLETLTSFIANQTGFGIGPDKNVTDTDRLGPLPSVPVKSIDWLLVFSVLFITGFTTYAILRTDSIRWLIPGQEHEHQD